MPAWPDHSADARPLDPQRDHPADEHLQGQPSGKGSLPTNLAAADRLCSEAFAKLESNEFDLAGHAAKAKAVLKQAQDEIKLATAAASKK